MGPFIAERCLDCDITETELQDRSLATLLLDTDYEEATKGTYILALNLICCFSRPWTTAL